MIENSWLTWLIAGFGAVTFLPLMLTQLLMLFQPDSRRVKDLIIGKDQDWRDKTHFKSALAFAWADWLVIFPLLIMSTYGVLTGTVWGYTLWIALGVLSVYFSIVFWVMEKEYTYPSAGAMAYYTYYWGFFLYWGIVAIIYSFIQIF